MALIFAGYPLPGVFKIFSKIFCRVTQLLLDTKKLVVFGNPVGTAGRAGLDQAGVQCHGQVGNGNIFGLDRKSTRLNSSH